MMLMLHTFYSFFILMSEQHLLLTADPILYWGNV